MIEKKYIEWIHKELDGLNDPEESKRLKDYLQKNEEARNFYEELRQLCRTLEEVEEIEPSPNLKKSIVNAINWKKYAPAAKKRRTPAWLVRPLLNPKYAIVFASGVLIGIVGYAVFFTSWQKPRTSDLVGMLMVDRSKVKTTQSIPFHQEEVTGRFQLQVGEETLIAELSSDSRQPIQMVLRFDPDDLKFLGFQRLTEAPVQLTTSKGVVELIHRGSCRSTILLKNLTSSETLLDLQIFLNQTIIVHRSIKPRPDQGSN